MTSTSNISLQNLDIHCAYKNGYKAAMKDFHKTIKLMKQEINKINSCSAEYGGHDYERRKGAELMRNDILKIIDHFVPEDIEE